MDWITLGRYFVQSISESIPIPSMFAAICLNPRTAGLTTAFPDHYPLQTRHRQNSRWWFWAQTDPRMAWNQRGFFNCSRSLAALNISVLFLPAEPTIQKYISSRLSGLFIWLHLVAKNHLWRGKWASLKQNNNGSHGVRPAVWTWGSLHDLLKDVFNWGNLSWHPSAGIF